MVSVDPPSGSRTGMVATIHVRFDRPMDPEACEVKGSSSRTKKESPDLPGVGISAPFPVAYDAARHEFTLHALLPGNTKTRVELRGFRGADGGQGSPSRSSTRWTTSCTGPSRKQESPKPDVQPCCTRWSRQSAASGSA